MSGNLTAVREMSGNLLKIREMSGKNLVREKLPKTVYCKLHISIKSIKMFICKAPLKQCSQRRLLEVCTLKKPCL